MLWFIWTRRHLVVFIPNDSLRNGTRTFEMPRIGKTAPAQCSRPRSSFLSSSLPPSSAPGAKDTQLGGNERLTSGSDFQARSLCPFVSSRAVNSQYILCLCSSLTAGALVEDGETALRLETGNESSCHSRRMRASREAAVKVKGDRESRAYRVKHPLCALYGDVPLTRHEKLDDFLWNEGGIKEMVGRHFIIRYYFPLSNLKKITTAKSSFCVSRV